MYNRQHLWSDLIMTDGSKIVKDMGYALKGPGVPAFQSV